LVDFNLLIFSGLGLRWVLICFIRAVTVLIAGFALVGIIRKRKDQPDGENILGEEDFEDNLLPGPGVDEKDGERFDGV
jgi:hypothetical protein